jgi:hypothetical protein
MISVDSTKVFRARLGKLGLDRGAVFQVMHSTAGSWGNPHEHSGLGIRRLKDDFFEVRSGLGVRLIFKAKKTCLVFYDAGTHADVQRFLRSL